MKEISFKMRKNYEQNRKFCAVKVETLLTYTTKFSYNSMFQQIWMKKIKERFANMKKKDFKRKQKNDGTSSH